MKKQFAGLSCILCVHAKDSHRTTGVKMEMLWLKVDIHPSWELGATTPFKNIKRLQKQS